MARTAFYRLWQLGRALTATVMPAERVLITQHLSLAEQRLFAQMSQFDQRHVLDVYHTLQSAGMTDPALLQAALLHDTGKVDLQGRQIPLVYYGLFVVLRRFAPAWYARAATHGGGLLHPFATHANHEQRSVHYVEQANSSPAVVAILRDYAAQRVTAATQALAWADDLN